MPEPADTINRVRSGRTMTLTELRRAAEVLDWYTATGDVAVLQARLEVAQRMQPTPPAPPNEASQGVAPWQPGPPPGHASQQWAPPPAQQATMSGQPWSPPGTSQKKGGNRGGLIAVVFLAILVIGWIANGIGVALDQGDDDSGSGGGGDSSSVDFVMPSVVGMDLQDAQDTMQDNDVFLSTSTDLLGTRQQVVDSNWVVCSQSIPAGQRVTGNVEGQIDFGVVKRGEPCP